MGNALKRSSSGTDVMQESDKRTADHDTLIRHAHTLMIEALQFLDSAGAHQSASLLDHAICVLPHEEAVTLPVRQQSTESN